MKRQFRTIGLLAVVGALGAGIATVSAHHSTTMFDQSKTMTINGEVVELRWVNPHVSLSVNGIVKERAEDGPAVWVMEMTSPGNLVRAGGWRRDAVKPGEKVEVAFSPLRDAERKGGALRKLTVVATGEVFTANIREQERPGLE
jgi:hypothetical protein